MSLLSHHLVAYVDEYSLENELLDLDDEDQRDEYDVRRKILKRRQKHSKPERIGREGIMEMTKSTAIVHAAAANNVVAVVTVQNKLVVSDATDTVKGSPAAGWDIAQMLAAAGAGDRRFIQGDRVTKLFLDPLHGRQIVIVFEKNAAALHIVLRTAPKDGGKELSGKELAKLVEPAKNYFELKQQSGDREGGGGGGVFGSGVFSGHGVFGIGGGGGSGGGGPAPSVESIGWAPWNPFPVSSGPLVMGSRTGGQLWGARLDAGGVGDVKRLFVLPNERGAILSVVQDRPRDANDARHLAIYAATAANLYVFYGRGSPDSLFTHMAQDGLVRADFTAPLQHVLSMAQGIPAAASLLGGGSGAVPSSAAAAAASTGSAGKAQQQQQKNDAGASLASVLSRDGILVKRPQDTDTIGFFIPCPTPPHQHHHHHHSAATRASSSGSKDGGADGKKKSGSGSGAAAAGAALGGASSRTVQIQSCNTSAFTCFWYAQGAEQQGLAGQWMWTHREGVSFGALYPPGFPAAPLLHGTITWSALLDAPLIVDTTAAAMGAAGGARAGAGGRFGAGAGSGDAAGAASSSAQQGSGSGSSKGVVKVYASSMCAFGMYVATDAGVSCIAHPALLPWKSRGGAERTNRRYTMTSLSGGAGGGGGGNEALFGDGGHHRDGAEDDDQPDEAATMAALDKRRAVASAGAGAATAAAAGAAATGAAVASSAAERAKAAAHALVLHAPDVKERTFYYMAAGSALRESARVGGGFGALRDQATGKMYLYTPLEVYELHVPGLRRQMFPLFVENMFEMASLCTVQLQLHQPTGKQDAGASGGLSAQLLQQQASAASSQPRHPTLAGALDPAEKQQQQQQLLQQLPAERDFATRLQAIRGCDLDCRNFCAVETKRLGFEAGRSLAARLRCYNANQEPDHDRAVVAAFLHAVHMSKAVAGKISKYHAVLAREAARCLVQMGAYSAAAPVLDEAHMHVTITEAVALLSTSPSSARAQATAAAAGSGGAAGGARFFFGGLAGLRSDERALLERDRLMAQEMYGRSAIQRMVDGRTIIGQYTAEIYCLVHWLVLVMVERCRRAEVMEDDFGENAAQEDAYGAPERNTAMPTNPVDVHEVQAALPFINDAAVRAVESARAAVRDMTCEQLPRLSVFRHNSVFVGGGVGGGGGGGMSGSRGRGVTSFGAGLGSPSGGGGGVVPGASMVFGAGASASGRDMSLLGVLTQSLTAFVQHHLDAGNLSFRVVERAVLAAASPKLASLVFVVMREFGVVLRNLTARGNFQSAARVLSNYCLSAQARSYWRLHASALMAHCPLDFLSSEFVDNVGSMALAPDDLVCMLAPAAYHVRYAGRPEHTQMCRSVVAVLRSYLGSMAGNNVRHRAEVLEKQTVMMMCHHNSDEELVDFISEALEADYIELGEAEVASRRASFSGFALRICAKARRVAGVAEVLFRQHHWFDAVRLLVRAGLVPKAKAYAVRVPNEQEKHRCWFEIVQRSVEQDPLRGSNAALEMLKESDGVLSVYDVFPELSEAVPMSALGSGLVLAVNEVAQRMKQTHHDVETARQITQRQRAQGDGVRRGVLAVSVDKHCDVCQGPLLASDELVYYPACGHGMHIACQRSGSDAPGLKAARERTLRSRTAHLRAGCPLCSSKDALLDFLTAPIDLPPGHPARLFGL